MHIQTKPACIFFLGLVFLLKIIVSGSFMPSAQQILQFSVFPCSLVFTVWLFTFLHYSPLNVSCVSSIFTICPISELWFSIIESQTVKLNNINFIFFQHFLTDFGFDTHIEPIMFHETVTMMLPLWNCQCSQVISIVCVQINFVKITMPFYWFSWTNFKTPTNFLEC